MRLTALAIICVGLSGGKSLADGILNKDIAVNRFDVAYEQHAAAHNQSVVIFAEDCQADVQTVCTYDLNGEAKVLISGSGEDKPIEGLSLIYSPQNDPDNLAKHYLMIIWAAEPGLPTKQRGKILKKLIDAAGQKSENILTFNGKNAKFSVAWALGTLMISAAKIE